MQKYSISEMSEISKITKKALRHYDEFGLLPARRMASNNYRYYTDDELLLSIPLKYYKQLGFKLTEIHAAFSADKKSFLQLRKMFMKKLTALREEDVQLRMRITSVSDWAELLNEADLVLQNNLQDVAVKYVSPEYCLTQSQTFANNMKAAIINPEFTNLVEEIGNHITGPVILRFLSMEDRLRGTDKQAVQVMQKTILPCPADKATAFGGFLAASCYHIGSHDSINETYKKLQRWCRANGYKCEPDSYERYVADYWTTNNENMFVTEVLVGISRLGIARRSSR